MNLFVATPTLKGKINYLGVIGDQNDLRKLYADASFLLVTSKNEGCPLAVAEALSQRCALISRKLHYTDDFLSNNGFITDTEEALVGCLNTIFMKEPFEFEDMFQKSGEIYHRYLRLDECRSRLRAAILGRHRHS